MTKKLLVKKKKQPKTDTEPSLHVDGDQLEFGMSMEVQKGLWLTFGYKSKLRKDEALEDGKDRVIEFVNGVMEREISKVLEDDDES